MARIPEQAAELLRDKNYAHVATLREDGSPHLTVVWIDYDGEHVLFNTAVGRAKERHLRRDPRAAVEVLDPSDPYNFLSVSGPVELVEGREAEDHIDKLARKYTGQERFRRIPSQKRILAKLTPEHVYTPG
jgi:PPOX class probable F420-dependent enzyme